MPRVTRWPIERLSQEDLQRLFKELQTMLDDVIYDKSVSIDHERNEGRVDLALDIQELLFKYLEAKTVVSGQTSIREKP